MPTIQFSGLASGIDSKALIDAVIEARQKKNELKQNEIDFLNGENDALEELNTKVLALGDLVDQFRTANAGGVSKKASSTAATVATAAVSASAGNGSYNLTVTSIADTAVGSFTHSYSALSDMVSAGSGTVTVNVGTGSDQVALTASVTGGVTTVQQLVDALNADSDASGRAVVAAVNVGTSAVPDYRITVTTQVEGTAQGTLDLQGGVTELDHTFPANINISQATDAVFSISGVGGSGTTITRQSNTIDDVISGMTFQLVSGGGASATITVGTDPDTTADLMQQIVDQYNDIVDYVNENNTVTRTEENSSVSNVFGTLAKTRIDDDFVSQFKSVFASATSSSGGAVTSMSALGISTNRDGTLNFDADEFKTKVAQDPTGATEVLNTFADATSGTSGFMYQFTKFQGFIDIGVDANNDEMDNLNDAIDQLNRYTDKLRTQMEEQFSRLESTIGELQNKQQALSGILASL